MFATLRSEVANVTVQPAAELKRGHVVFSISIDLVGSTDAKTRVMKLADGEVTRIDELNTAINKEFRSVERAFYKAATSRYGFAEPLRAQQVFRSEGHW